MRVLLTHERFAPDFGGGGEAMVLAIARHLIHAGVTVRVLTTGDPYSTDYEGISTIRLPISRYAMNLAVPTIAKLAQEVDLIQTFNYHACLSSLLGGKLSRKPVVCTFLGLIQETWTDMRGPLLGRMWMFWEKLLVRRNFSRLLFLTEDNREAAIHLGADRKRTVVNVPGIVAGEFSPAAVKDNIVVFVGKFDVRKGIFDVLEVARALPCVPFFMIGWGSREAELRSMAPANVRIFTQPQRAVIRDCVGRAAIFLLPSRGEGFPVALLEAMAAGCAVVASVPLHFEGFRVAPGDRTAMIRAIAALWQNPAEARRLGETNIGLANQYSWDEHVNRLLQVYREVLDERHRPIPLKDLHGNENRNHTSLHF